MSCVVPILVLLLVFYALIKRVDPYSAFIKGASDALPSLLRILPNISAVLVAISVFRCSGVMELIQSRLSPLFSAVGIPSELTHLILLRPLSGSGTLSLLSELLMEYGPDTFIGLCASVCVGSIETIVYVISLYCGSVGITKTRYAFPAAIISGIVGIFSGILFVRLFCAY